MGVSAEDQVALVDQQIAEKGAEGILKEYFAAENAEAREIVFRCRCSREKAASAVLSMGREDAEKLLEEAGEISVHCHDCNTDYFFGKEEVAALFGGGERK